MLEDKEMVVSMATSAKRHLQCFYVLNEVTPLCKLKQPNKILCAGPLCC